MKIPSIRAVACASALFLATALAPALAPAQETAPADRGPWEVSLLAGGFDDWYEFDPDGSVFYLDPDRNVMFGASARRHFGSGFSLGVEGRYFPWDIRPASGGLTDMNSYYVSGILGYTLGLHERLDLYGVGGVTGAYWSPSGADTELDLGFTYGGGTRIYLTESFALMGDARFIQVPSALEDVSQQVTDLTANETFRAYSISGGVTFFLGGEDDSDGDGVADGDDACPDTPRGVRVDARGCAVDSDGDGVADHLDKCPNTPAGARVDSEGCPTDSDDDGVYDGLDRCPNTPRGAEVDDEGCALDSDGDGVPNGIDACPDTPRGDEVDSRGCTVEPEPEPEPEPQTFTFMADVNFEFDSSVLTDEGRTRLRSIGDTIVSEMGDETAITLEGHADSIGTEAYNRDLSRARAESVRSFLVESFSDLRAQMFTIRALGESQPVADNATEEGRAQNRRVEIIVNP